MTRRAVDVGTGTLMKRLPRWAIVAEVWYRIRLLLEVNE